MILDLLFGYGDEYDVEKKEALYVECVVDDTRLFFACDYR